MVLIFFLKDFGHWCLYFTQQTQQQHKHSDTIAKQKIAFLFE